jgi:hypothetical protein
VYLKSIYPLITHRHLWQDKGTQGHIPQRPSRASKAQTIDLLRGFPEESDRKGKEVYINQSRARWFIQTSDQEKTLFVNKKL